MSCTSNSCILTSYIFQYSWDKEAARKIENCYAYVLSYFSDTFEAFVADNGASPMGIDYVKEAVST
jgi:hypothetical protein